MTHIPPSQIVIYRAVEGAVRNVAHAHPAWPINRPLARSIAKRAAGTLASSWAPALAAWRSDRASLSDTLGARPAPDLSGEGRLPTGRGRASLLWVAPASKALIRRLGMMAGEARKAGRDERAAAIADVLRVIDEMQKEA